MVAKIRIPNILFVIYHGAQVNQNSHPRIQYAVMEKFLRMKFIKQNETKVKTSSRWFLRGSTKSIDQNVHNRGPSTTTTCGRAVKTHYLKVFEILHDRNQLQVVSTAPYVSDLGSRAVTSQQITCEHHWVHTLDHWLDKEFLRYSPAIDLQRSNATMRALWCASLHVR